MRHEVPLPPFGGAMLVDPLSMVTWERLFVGDTWKVGETREMEILLPEGDRRVLEEAENDRHPLLERLRFLSISGNNLDEFYMVRVAGLVGQMRAKLPERSDDNLTPAEQLELVRKFGAELMAEQDRRWLQLKEELATEGIKVVDGPELTAAERDWLDARFLEPRLFQPRAAIRHGVL